MGGVLKNNKMKAQRFERNKLTLGLFTLNPQETIKEGVTSKDNKTSLHGDLQCDVRM